MKHSTTTKILAAPPLGAAALTGALAAIAQALVPVDMPMRSTVLAACIGATALAATLIAFLVSRTVLRTTLGCDLDALLARVRGADGDGSAKCVTDCLDAAEARTRLASDAVTKCAECVNSSGESLASEANEILFNSQMQAAATNDVKQSVADVGVRIGNVSSLVTCPVFSYHG